MWLINAEIHNRFGRLHENGSTEQEKAESLIGSAFFINAPFEFWLGRACGIQEKKKR